MKSVACQVCGNYTISEHGSCDICPVCFWEDDGLYDDPNEVWGGPNYELSLTQARKNYQEFGAICKRILEHVRTPEQSELPENNKV
jgi:hypothetical protein